MRFRLPSWWRHRADPHGESAEALRQAEQDARDTNERWPEVQRLATSLREATERNHFSEAMEFIAGQRQDSKKRA